jgi:hypothetical protein
MYDHLHQHSQMKLSDIFIVHVVFVFPSSPSCCAHIKAPFLHFRIAEFLMISLTADRTLLWQTWSRFWYIYTIHSTWQRKRPSTLHDGVWKQTSWQLHHTCIWSWYQTCDPLLDLKMSALVQSPTLSWILNLGGGGGGFVLWFLKILVND